MPVSTHFECDRCGDSYQDKKSVHIGFIRVGEAEQSDDHSSTYWRSKHRTGYFMHFVLCLRCGADVQAILANTIRIPVKTYDDIPQK